MNLNFDLEKATGYKSAAQKARVLTEPWVHEHLYCLHCGNPALDRQPHNHPAGDFFCPKCRETYELKSGKNSLRPSIPDGAFDTMMGRILDNTAPNLLVLRYERLDSGVKDFCAVPRRFLLPGVIEKRPPLKPSARRAGWVGCNILLGQIPESGRIFVVREGVASDKKRVLEQWRKTAFLDETSNLSQRGWLLDVMRCVESFGGREFTLQEMYAFAPELKQKHPENHHVHDKIRQQLQVLRDKGFLCFTGKGRYRAV